MSRELAAHRALERLGYPAPRVFTSRDDSTRSGERFLVMTRLRGASPLAEILEPGAVTLKPWTLIPQLATAIFELPVLGTIIRGAQATLYRRYLATFTRARPLDIEALHYYEVQHFLSEIVRGLKGVAAGRRFEGRIEQRWLHPECINQTLERLSARIVRPLDAPV